MAPLHPRVRRIGRFEGRGNPRNKLDGRCNARANAQRGLYDYDRQLLHELCILCAGRDFPRHHSGRHHGFHVMPSDADDIQRARTWIDRQVRMGRRPQAPGCRSQAQG